MKKIKNSVTVSQYVSAFFSTHGVSDVFMVTGGGAMFLNDAFSSNKSFKTTCFHHEQACTMAAESYFKVRNVPALVNVTTGPGSTNAITGVYGAYVDSSAMIVISGQVKTTTLKRNGNEDLRQLGDQEIDIIPIVKSITKYSVMIDDPRYLDFHLQKALYLSISGRPGPVWLDIPINIQSSLVPAQIKAFTPPKKPNWKTSIKNELQHLYKKLFNSKRPVIILGTGVHTSETARDAYNFAKKLSIPIVSSFCASDVVPSDDDLFIGRQGTIGDRAGNFAVENADLVIILGARMGIRQVSYDWTKFAHQAYKVMIDIDINELDKPTLNIDLKINTDLKIFFNGISVWDLSQIPKKEEYLNWCTERKKKYPVVEEKKIKSKLLNPYAFMKEVSKYIPEHTAIVTADGAAAITSFQAFDIKKGQRLFSNSGSAPMGFDLPAALGASIAVRHLKKMSERIICFAGDGSIMMNLQELQTIATLDRPISIFIINNGGYLSILQTQKNYFKNNIFGCIPSKELEFPNFKKVAQVFNIDYISIRSIKDFKNLDKILNSKRPQIFEVFVDRNQFFEPKLISKQNQDGTFSSPDLDDMYPFLSKKELKKNRLNPGDKI